MNDFLIFLIVFGTFAALVITLVVLLWLYQRKRERERTSALKSSATMLGWQFAETVPLTYLPNLDHFQLFTDGHSKQIKNLMYGEWLGVKAALFDYIYTVGSGKHAHTYYQSVAYIEPRDLSIPYFSLRPENFMHKVMSKFGYQDIDFGNRPVFSNQYLLRGGEEPAIRATFEDRLLGSYEANPGLCTDGGGNQLFVFRQGYRVPPQEVQSFIERAYQLQTTFPRPVRMS